MDVQSESGFDLLQPEEILEALAVRGLSDHVLLYESTTTSTNADVLAHYDKHDRLAIAICEKQTAGKSATPAQTKIQPVTAKA